MEQYLQFITSGNLTLNPAFWPSEVKNRMLMHFIKLGKLDKVVELHQAGANITDHLPVGDGSKQTPLQFAADNGREEIVRYLLTNGVYTLQNKKDVVSNMCYEIHERPPLSDVTRLKVIEHILDSGLDVTKLFKIFDDAMMDGHIPSDFLPFLRGYTQLRMPEQLMNPNSAISRFLSRYN